MSKTVGLVVLLTCVVHVSAVCQRQCGRFFSPVCAEGRTFGNFCVAECNGYKLADVVQGECGKNCTCTREFKPVCAKGKTFNNPCLAKCNGYLKYNSGACGPKPKPCTCTADFTPVCANGKTYGNGCAAQCAGFVAAQWVQGECGKGKKCECPKIKAPVCADKGKKTFANICVARCFGYLTSVKGACRPPPVKCVGGFSSAKCTNDICGKSQSPCAKHPAVTCLTNPCISPATNPTAKLTCEPIYVDKAGKLVANCNEPLPPTECAPGSATAKCKGDPCKLTKSRCKGNKRYVCVSNSCGKLTYLGTPLKDAMCTAIFVDPLTRKVAKNCIVK